MSANMNPQSSGSPEEYLPGSAPQSSEMFKVGEPASDPKNTSHPLLQSKLREPYTYLPDWAEYWNLRTEDLSHKPRKEVERQFMIREIITTEHEYQNSLLILSSLYRDALTSSNRPIIPPSRLQTFVTAVFGNLEELRHLNSELLRQLHVLEEEQGPWITDISGAFQDWISRSSSAYISYASNLPKACYTVRQEDETNIAFAGMLDQVRKNKYSNRLNWESYLNCPITRIRKYPIILQTLQRKTSQPEDALRLNSAVALLKQTVLECVTAFEREEALLLSQKNSSNDGT